MKTPLESQYDVRMSGKFLMIYMCNFHVLSHLLLIYICKLHWIEEYNLCFTTLNWTKYCDDDDRGKGNAPKSAPTVSKEAAVAPAAVDIEEDDDAADAELVEAGANGGKSLPPLPNSGLKQVISQF